MHAPDDQLLAERLRSGDREALGLLYDRYAPVAMAVAVRVVSDREQAEDLVHDAFVAVWQKIERFDPSRGSLRSWLLTIVRNRAIDRLRSTRPSIEVGEADEQSLLRTGPNPTWEEAVRQSSASQLRDALARLPEEQRQAVELAYFGGRTYREIAVLTGVPQGTASGRLRLALAKLRDSLALTEAAPIGVVPERLPVGASGPMTLQYACADVDALAGALALGAVDPDELRAAREHLATCAEPHAELRSLVGADTALAAGLEPMQPSAGLRDRLMATVADVPQESATLPAAEQQPYVGAPARRGWLDWLSPNVARPLAVAAMVALIAVGIWGLSLSSQLNEQQQALDAVAAAIANGQTAHRVEGEAGRGYVVDTPGSGASFVVTDVSELDADQLYVLWLIDAAGTPVDVGAFAPSDAALAVVPVDQDLSGFQTFAVTVEAERVDAPTSDPVMVGTVEG